MVACERLATLYQEREAWSKAANTLAKIDLESGMRVVDPEFKLQKYIQISMLFLEDGDSVSAEANIRKASSLISSCNDPGLELQYRSLYARILDRKRRFVEAALRYYDLSRSSDGDKCSSEFAEREEQRMEALESAVKCAILAAAGPQRSRILATLYKDERTSRSAQFPMLEKVYMERILSYDEILAFSKTLSPHQLAETSDGSTVLDRAIREHNLEACSKLYTNITIESLAELLGVSLHRAQSIVAHMINEDRLPAEIDQVSGIVRFTQSASSAARWDGNIQEICKITDTCLDIAKEKNLL